MQEADSSSPALAMGSPRKNANGVALTEPGVIDYSRLYEYRFRGVDRRKKLAVWREISMWIYKRLGRPSRVLDPAAGALEFLQTVPSEERWGVDLQMPSDFVEGPGMKFLVGDAMDVSLPSDYFDCVFVSNFLEHLQTPADVQRFLIRMRRLLKPGGRIACMGPNFKYCAPQYFDCADHRLSLSHLSVEEHLYAAGFEIESSSPRFLPYSFRGALPVSPILVRLYLRAPWLWRVLGKQFLVIGRRLAVKQG